MSESKDFPETIPCVACGKELITERYMGMYPENATPNNCIHTLHNLDLPPFSAYGPYGHFMKNIPKAIIGKFSQ